MQTQTKEDNKWKGCLFKSNGRRSQGCACAACEEWRNDKISKRNKGKSLYQLAKEGKL